MVCISKTLHFLLLIISCSLILAKEKTIRVHGRIICGNKPLVNQVVKLWNHKSFGKDDQLASVRTNNNGYYALQGRIRSSFAPNLKLKFYTNCDEGNRRCERKIALEIPKKYATEYGRPISTFDGGIMNLALKFNDETRNCF